MQAMRRVRNRGISVILTIKQPSLQEATLPNGSLPDPGQRVIKATSFRAPAARCGPRETHRGPGRTVPWVGSRRGLEVQCVCSHTAKCR